MSPTDMQEATLTFFPDQQAKHKRVVRMTYDALRDTVLKKSAKTKMELPWIKAAEFGKNVTAANCIRNNDNVIAVTGVEIDADNGKMSFETACERAQKAKLGCLIYTSASHTPSDPRWRAVAFTSKPLAPTERDKLCARANGVFEGNAAPESFTLSQAYLYGHVGDDRAHACVITGRHIDECDDLDATAIYKNGTNSPVLPASDVSHVSSGPGLTFGTIEALEAAGCDPVVVGMIRNGVESWQSDMQMGRRHFKVHAELKRLGVTSAEVCKQIYKFGKIAVDAAQGGGGFDRYVEHTWGNVDQMVAAPVTMPAPEFSMLGTTLPQPMPWLAEGFLLNGAITMLTGPSGGGKSVVNVHVAVSCALGQPWSICPVRKQVNVLLINAEDDVPVLESRVWASLESFKGHRKDNLKVIACRLHTMKAPNYYLVQKSDTIGPTKLHKIVDDYIAAHDIGLLMYDPAISAHIGLDENSAELQALFEMFRNVARKHNIPVLLTHHNKKAGTQGDADAARGSSTAVAAVRVVWNVDPMTEDEARDLLANAADFGNHLSMSNSKANYSSKSHRVWFKMESVEVCEGETAPALSQVSFVDADLTEDQLTEIVGLVDEGMADAAGKVTRYTARGSDATRLDAMIARDFGLSGVQAKSVVEKLTRRLLIEIKTYKKPNRHDGKGYFVRPPTLPTGGAA